MQKVAWPITIVQSEGLRPWTGLFVKKEFKRDPGDDARQRDRQDEQERDRVPAEETKAADCGRRGRPEHQRDRGRDAGGLQ